MNLRDESSQAQRRTVVEHGTKFNGSMSSTCPVDVHGHVEGDIETPALTVSATGSVHGRARVGSVSSDGELSGEFDAEHVELAGRVRDNTVIRARSLNVKLGSETGKLQVIFGVCELAIGDEPAERAQVSHPAPSAELAAVSAPAEAVPAAAIDAVPPPQAPPAQEAEPIQLALSETGIITAHEEASVQASDERPRKQKKGNGESAQRAWSQPPSQPPPAS